MLVKDKSKVKDMVNKVNLLGKYLGVRAAKEIVNKKRGGNEIAIIHEWRIKKVLSKGINSTDKLKIFVIKKNDEIVIKQSGKAA